MRSICLVILSIFILSSVIYAQEAIRIHPRKATMAVRINPEAPKIDGILDDEIWHKAPSSGEFLQRDPKEGEPPSEETKVQIGYDDDAIYFGITCYDREPDKIIARMSRRDGWTESDMVSVNLDAYHDHQTGNWFCVNAAGVLNDGQMFNDGWEDSSWNGVWEAKTSINKEGWCAEYKIPYHVLRFSEKEEYTWGMNIIRRICRKDEMDLWTLVTKKDNGWISNFGHIEGIRGINPPNHLEFAPFAVGSSAIESDADKNDLFSSAGLDMRYGITSNVSLNVTVNPDFGQIEADPAELNLSVFETYLKEKRPFFIEGSTIFASPSPEMPKAAGVPGLFYSRRIGRQPGMFAIPEGSQVVGQPKATTILSAAKLSGKTEKKTAFGILNAVTANEYADIESKYIDTLTGIEQTRREEFRIEPMTNFFVGRVQQDILKKSNVGATLTAVNRDDASPSYAGDMDAYFKFGKRDYSLYTRLAGSQTGESNDRKSGYDAFIYLSKFSGVLGGQLFLNARSPEFDVNDLGFMDRADIVHTGLHLKADTQKPHWLIQRASANFNAWGGWNYDGVNLRKGINFNTWSELRSPSPIRFYFASIDREFETLDDMETRGGPLMLRPSHITYEFGTGTDGRKPISFELFGGGMRDDKGLNSHFGFHLGMNINLASGMQLGFGPGSNFGTNFAQWIKNVDDDGDGNNDHYVFGELKDRVVDFTTRLDISFTTNASLQLYIQPFIAVGDYSNFKELARPKSYEFIKYNNIGENPDFHDRSLRSNLVFRWEYRPGSTLFLVWSQSRSASFEDANHSLDFSDIKGSFSDNGKNVFLAKLSYWLGI